MEKNVIIKRQSIAALSEGLKALESALKNRIIDDEDAQSINGLFMLIKHVINIQGCNAHEFSMTEKKEVGLKLAVIFDLDEVEDGKFDLWGYNVLSSIEIYNLTKRIITGDTSCC